MCCALLSCAAGILPEIMLPPGMAPPAAAEGVGGADAAPAETREGIEAAAAGVKGGEVGGNDSTGAEGAGEADGSVAADTGAVADGQQQGVSADVEMATGSG